MKIRMSNSLNAATLCLSLAFLGCTDIKTFEAKPRNICLGNAVTLTWQGQGSIIISAAPTLPNTGPKASSGSEEFEPAQDTRFIITASNAFASKTAEVDVLVTPRTLEFGHLASCSIADRAINVSIPLSDSQVSSHHQVLSITNMNPRDVRVSKGTTVSFLPAASSSTAFENQSAAGMWTVTAPLREGESCEDGLKSIAS